MGSLDSRRDEDLELYIYVDSWRRMIILKVIGLREAPTPQFPGYN
jgi:hypothetical protein